jgi:L-threonylcarbamoyladenylate synthase
VSEVFELDGADDVPLQEAEKALSRGEVVVFPTDTVYGVGSRPDIPGATNRLFEAKLRPRHLTLPVLAATVEDAADVGMFDHRAWALADRFWPGGLTIILPRAPRALDWDLGDEASTVGLRIPDHGIAVALLARTGPLAVTSANRSGEPTPTTCEGIRASLGDRVSVYLCTGAIGGNVPSTVVDLAGGKARVLREGWVARKDLLEVLDLA